MFRAASAHHQEVQSVSIHTGPADSHTPDYVVPDVVLIQTEPPDDEHLLLETCRGVKIRINTFRKECVRLVIN